MYSRIWFVNRVFSKRVCCWRSTSRLYNNLSNYRTWPAVDLTGGRKFGADDLTRAHFAAFDHAGVCHRRLTTVVPPDAQKSPCWKCKQCVPAGDLFCGSCSTIQPPEQGRNFFEILGVAPSFDQDENDLTKKFRDLQKMLHPDKFSGKSRMERGFSDEHSSIVNKSYQTLIKPLTRGIYLLELKGENIEEGESDMDASFLMKIMEINEELDTSDLSVVQRIEVMNREELKHHMLELSQAFSRDDIAKAKMTLKFLKYYSNIEEKVKNLRFELTGTS